MKMAWTMHRFPKVGSQRSTYHFSIHIQWKAPLPAPYIEEYRTRRRENQLDYWHPSPVDQSQIQSRITLAHPSSQTLHCQASNHERQSSWNACKILHRQRNELLRSGLLWVLEEFTWGFVSMYQYDYAMSHSAYREE